MGDVAGWLDGLGLGQYANVFADNDITPELLADLTDDDLRDLGIASLGHRKRLLAGIAKLAPAPEAAATVAPPVSEGERRPVTIMFADLAGFTALSRELDPEDVHDLLSRFFATVDGVIQSHGGTIDKHIGDCTMGLFGAPVAHGDDSQRAVRAALAVRGAVRQMAQESEHAIGVHIGIARGEVVASKTGSDIHSAYTVTGDSVNIAARLTDRAKDGEILLDRSVHDDVGSLAAAEPVGMLQLDGIAEPVESWRLKGLGGADMASRGVFVGRRTELHQFAAALTACRDLGAGSTILVRGEAGIGKTRLIQEFCDRARQDGFACHTALVLDFGAGVEKDPVHAFVRALLGLPPAASEESQRCAIERAVTEQGIDAPQRVFLNDFLGLPQPAELRAVIDAMDNDTRTSGRIDTAVILFERTSRRQELLLVIEDVHWADALTLEAATRIAVATSRAPIILVLTTRIEGDQLDAAWRSRIGAASVMTFDLARLNETDARTLATAVGGIPEIIERCLARAEGNPLFLEQLLRNVTEDATVPGSVQSVVLARIDRLDPIDRHALQAAAVLGQRFDAAAVRHILADARYDFDRLVSRYLVRPEGEGTFLFAHALVRDGVYASLLRGRLRSLHHRAAEWLEDRDPVLFAEHLALAGDARAPRAFLAAAERQRATYHDDVALSLISRGRRMASAADDRFELACAEGEVLLDLGRTRESLAAFAAAEEFADGPEETARARYGRASGLRLTDQIDEALEILEGAEAAARQAGRIDLLARIHHLRGNLYFPIGRIRECLAEQTAAYRAAEETGSPELIALALGGLGDAEYANSLLLSAYDHFRSCVALAREHGLGRIQVANGAMVPITQLVCGPIAGAYEEALANIEAARKVGHARGEIISQHAAYFAQLYVGNLEAALAHIEEAQALTERIRVMRFEPENVIFEAVVARRMGQRDRARSLAERAYSLCDKTTFSYLGPAVLGILAETIDDPDRRRWALGEGEKLLASGSLSHNHMHFRASAIDASLADGEWDEAERHAAALEAAFTEEPTPFIRFLVARGRMLARHGRGDDIAQREIARLVAEGRELGYLSYVEALDRISAGATQPRVS